MAVLGYDLGLATSRNLSFIQCTTLNFIRGSDISGVSFQDFLSYNTEIKVTRTEYKRTL